MNTMTVTNIDGVAVDTAYTVSNFKGPNPRLRTLRIYANGADVTIAIEASATDVYTIPAYTKEEFVGIPGQTLYVTVGGGGTAEIVEY